MPMLDTAWSGQTDNMPESPCLGCMPSTHPGKSPSPRHLLFLLKYKTTNLETTPPATSFTISHSAHSIPALINPRSRCRTTRDGPYTPRLLKLFRLANPKPTYPVFSVPSGRSHNKSSCPATPSLSLPWDGSQRRRPSWPALTRHVLPFGTEEYNTLFFQWQSSPDPLPLPYLNNTEPIKTPRTSREQWTTWLNLRLCFPWLYVGLQTPSKFHGGQEKYQCAILLPQILKFTSNYFKFFCSHK